MNCPTCGHNRSKVIDSRAAHGIVRRRRSCLLCRARQTTYELSAETLATMGGESGLNEIIDGMFEMLNVMQEAVKEKLKGIRQTLPGAYLKLKSAKIPEKEDK